MNLIILSIILDRRVFVRNRYTTLLLIGVIGGFILAAALGTAQYLTNKQVYFLLVNMDYIPLLRTLPPHPIVGLLFHLTFATLAILILYYILKKVDFHHSILMYIIWNTIGGGLLYAITVFSKK